MTDYCTYDNVIKPITSFDATCYTRIERLYLWFKTTHDVNSYIHLLRLKYQVSLNTGSNEIKSSYNVWVDSKCIMELYIYVSPKNPYLGGDKVLYGFHNDNLYHPVDINKRIITI